MPHIDVDLGPRSYPILIKNNLLAQAGELIAPHFRGRNIFIIADQNVYDLHGATLRAGLGDLPQHWICVPPGEASKSLSQFSQIVERILEKSPERRDLILAFGGGVIGDLAGYVAASVLRGLDFIQIPTSLLAQVDSSVGGKTGINSSHGKNLIGAFYQPKQVLIDLDVLKSLPDRELRAGYAEIVKYGLIDQPDFFNWLEIKGSNVLSLMGDVGEAISRSCKAKARIVGEDEFESGRRALLNLGHTFAHAFEAAGNYDGRILHGEAVSIGLVCAYRLSHILGLASGQDVARIKRHLGDLGLPTDLKRFKSISFSLQGLKSAMRRDKKVQSGTIRFILAHGIGQAFVSDGVEGAYLDQVLTDLLS